MTSSVPEGILVKLEDSPAATGGGGLDSASSRLKSHHVTSRISSILSSITNLSQSEDDDDPFGLKTSSVRTAQAPVQSVSTGVLVSIDDSPRAPGLTWNS